MSIFTSRTDDLYKYVVTHASGYNADMHKYAKFDRVILFGSRDISIFTDELTTMVIVHTCGSCNIHFKHTYARFH